MQNTVILEIYEKDYVSHKGKRTKSLHAETGDRRAEDFNDYPSGEG